MLMDEKFVPAVIYDADRVVITAALLRRGSNARNVPLQLASFGQSAGRSGPIASRALPDGIA